MAKFALIVSCGLLVLALAATGHSEDVNSFDESSIYFRAADQSTKEKAKASLQTLQSKSFSFIRGVQAVLELLKKRQQGSLSNEDKEKLKTALQELRSVAIPFFFAVRTADSDLKKYAGDN